MPLGEETVRKKLGLMIKQWQGGGMQLMAAFNPKRGKGSGEDRKSDVMVGVGLENGKGGGEALCLLVLRSKGRSFNCLLICFSELGRG